MGWTVPRTWVAAETVTAALLNTHLRDDMAFVGKPPMLRASNSAQLSLPANGVQSAAATFDTTIGTGPTIVSSSRLTMNTAGLFRVTARIQRTGNNQQEYSLQVRKNAAGSSSGGTQLGYAFEAQGGNSAIAAGYGRNIMWADIFTFTASDYIELFAAQMSASAVPVDVILTVEYISS